MPMIVRSAGAPEALSGKGAVGVPELVPRNCRLETYTPIEVPPVRISSDVIAYTSPDSTFAVTKRLLDQARTSILIGIYDFTAAHVKNLIEKALARGVKVELMLDIDGQSEERVFKDLELLGADCTPAPAC